MFEFIMANKEMIKFQNWEKNFIEVVITCNRNFGDNSLLEIRSKDGYQLLFKQVTNDTLFFKIADHSSRAFFIEG
jgi:hypothetical protein